jgi:hypothetical protein
VNFGESSGIKNGIKHLCIAPPVLDLTTSTDASLPRGNNDITEMIFAISEFKEMAPNMCSCAFVSCFCRYSCNLYAKVRFFVTLECIENGHIFVVCFYKTFAN